MDKDIAKAVKEAMELSISIEEMVDGKDLFIILMALTKVVGVMLAEAKGMNPDMVDRDSAISWFSLAVAAAYRGHEDVMAATDATMH